MIVGDPLSPQQFFKEQYNNIPVTRNKVVKAGTKEEQDATSHT